MTLTRRQRQLREFRRIERNAIIRRVRCNPWCFKSLPKKFRDDDQIALIAVNGYGNAIMYVSDRLKGNRRLVRAALENDGSGYWEVSSMFTDDYDLLMTAVRCNGNALGHASLRLKGTYAIVLAAVKQCGAALRYVSVVLQANREVVMAAVTSDGMALQFASDELRSNEAIVDAAVNQERRAERYSLVPVPPPITFDLLDNEDIWVPPEVPPEEFAERIGLGWLD